jgi:hypothetical protein
MKELKQRLETLEISETYGTGMIKNPASLRVTVSNYGTKNGKKFKVNKENIYEDGCTYFITRLS